MAGACQHDNLLLAVLLGVGFVRPGGSGSAERSNLTIRMLNRRFTRLTNAFSKKVENHAHSVALMMTYYNFVRIHKTLRVTPAMAARVTDRLWEVTDIVALVDSAEAKPAKRGSYKKALKDGRGASPA